MCWCVCVIARMHLIVHEFITSLTSMLIMIPVQGSGFGATSLVTEAFRGLYLSLARLFRSAVDVQSQHAHVDGHTATYTSIGTSIPGE